MINGPRYQIRRGWEGAGRTGTVLATVWAEQWWAVILWDDEEDPDCFKLDGLERKESI